MNIQVERKTIIASVTLTLTAEEAGVLAAILENVGGNPDTSSRSISDRITRGLWDNDIVPTLSSHEVRGNIYFHDTL